jgi:RNA polymerase II subunit A C-terminal domain phosphatase SSU72
MHGFVTTGLLNRYTTNGILHMLDRNRRIKTRPERFQLNFDKFDVIFTCEERVYDQVVEGNDVYLLIVLQCTHMSCYYARVVAELNSRPATDNSPVHVINIDIQDNHEEATIGSFKILELAEILSQSDDLDNDIDELLQEFEQQSGRTILHTIAFQ